jgi:hypothetical protein
MIFHPNSSASGASPTREPNSVFKSPVLSGDDARWAVRATIDAVVVHAYGLTRDQYAHVLSTFSHSSYKDAPRQCLAAFDELQSLGLAAFTRSNAVFLLPALLAAWWLAPGEGDRRRRWTHLAAAADGRHRDQLERHGSDIDRQQFPVS